MKNIHLIPVNEFGSEITVKGYGFDKFIYKTIVQKEKPKQVTIEEAAIEATKFPKKCYTNSEMAIESEKMFIEGAKSESAKNYWFEQFKNETK